MTPDRSDMSEHSLQTAGAPVLAAADRRAGAVTFIDIEPRGLRPAAFLDIDGTLVQDVPFNVDRARVRLARGAREGAWLLREAGYALVVVTNQAGVARGLFPVEALGPVRARLEDLLGLYLDGFYVCPHHPEGQVPAFACDCTCRKPLPGMLTRAARDLRLDLARSWMIGDVLHDIEAGSRAGCRTALLLAGAGDPEPGRGLYRTPTLVAADLSAAARRILRAPAAAQPAAGTVG